MNKIITFLWLICTNVIFCQSNYYVSINGSNGNNGSANKPWKTVQFSIDQLFPGDTLNITEGVYNEKLTLKRSGEKDFRIVIRGVNNAVIDATNILGNAVQNAILKIEDQSYITIQNLELANNIQNFAQGILVSGSSSDITLSHNKIHDIHFSQNPKQKATSNRNAQGIIVYGTSSEKAITNLLIEFNELYNCRLGYSEGIAVNGNVDGFEIKNNEVYNLTNIGIDVIGHEGVSKDPLKDQARNGIVSNNLVYNCISPYATSAGIYVDGGKNLKILNNITFNNGYGIEIGCENSEKTTDSITVRNNIIYKNQVAGISVGGFDYPKSGKVMNSSFYNNTLYDNTINSKSISEVYISYNENIIFENNIIYSGESGKTVYEQLNSTGVTFNYNLYYSLSKNVYFNWNDRMYINLENFKKETGLDEFSMYQDPKFLNEDTFNFSLAETSPAINNGNPKHIILHKETDINNQPRINDSLIDIGVSEFSNK